MFEKKEIYTIDFTEVKTYHEFHTTIRDSLGWPYWYGCNWDAFWDLIQDMTSESVHIRILGLENIRNRFDDDADMLIQMFRDIKKQKAKNKNITICVEIEKEDGTREELA